MKSIGDGGGQETAADEMALTSEVGDAGLGRGQADQVFGHEVVAQFGRVGGRTGLDVPRAGDVDAQNGDATFAGLLEDGDEFVEGGSHGRLEGEAEEGVDDQVRGGQGRLEG